jgi:hypothetical protein
MHMRILSAIVLSLFLAGAAQASQAKVQSKQSNWTKIKEIFK